MHTYQPGTHCFLRGTSQHPLFHPSPRQNNCWDPLQYREAAFPSERSVCACMRLVCGSTQGSGRVAPSR
ncbi:hypothetical protein BC834DRAFT_913009, partial [Gloeopeniophorella convolvens]